MLRIFIAAGFLLLPLTGALVQAPQPERTTQAHLPRLETLLRQVREAQANVSANQLRYLCRETVSISHADPVTGGQLTDVSTFETFYVHQQPVSRLLERNQKPLTSSEQAAEEVRVQRQVQAANATEDTAAEKWENTLGGLLLLHAHLLHERRVLVDGRPIITLDIRAHDSSKAIFDMLSASKTPTVNLLQQVAESVDGELWIDEQDHVIVRMDARAPSNLSFGSSLLAPKNFQVACYTTARIASGVYVPKEWCGTVLPIQSLKIPDAVARWNERVRRTTYALDGCRLYRSTAHIVSEPMIEAPKP